MYEIILNILNYLLPFLFVLTFLVFIHEMGHYLVARINSVKVDVFSIGFGPEIYGIYDKHGTRWKISLIPLGGYVKFYGDMGASSFPDKEKINHKNVNSNSIFHNKSLFQRSAIVTAGPLANFLFAIFIFSIIFFIYGKPYSVPIINEVLPNSSAEYYGLKNKDRIVSIGNRDINSFDDIKSIVQLNANQELNFQILRDSKILNLIVKPKLVRVKDSFGNEYNIGQLGIRSNETEYLKLNFFQSISYSVDQTINVCLTSLIAVKQMIFGKRSAEELAGVIGIAKMTGDVAQVGFVSLLQLMAFLSISLGLVNLFPIPMLDGGHLLFYFFEAILGKPLSLKMQEFGMKLGFMFVVFLMFLTAFNDLNRFKFFDSIYKIFS